MSKDLFIILGSLFAIACATEKTLDRDLRKPSYYQGQGVFIHDGVALDNVTWKSNPTFWSYGGSKENAILGLIESGISLAAYPDYYKPSTIRGSCVLGEVQFAQAPCRHFVIDLIDESSHVVGQTTTNDSGQFAFYVRKEKTYFLRLSNPKYRLPNFVTQPLQMGSQILLEALRAE